MNGIEGSPGVPASGHALGYLGLFSAVGTLVCCALPSVFVLLGLGAAVASVTSAAPWLVTLSRHKGPVFVLTAALITANFYYVYRLAPRFLVERGACAPGDATSCARATRTSRAMLWISSAVLVIGFSAAYVLPVVIGWMEP